MKIHFFTCLAFLFIGSCGSPAENREDLLESVRETEKSFARLAADAGLQEAFTAYAHPDAVLNRGELIKGKDAIHDYYGDPAFEFIRLKWEPSFVDISSSGDMAYTYGPYELIRTDSTGAETRNTGIFHTVWKRMSDGSWKYVYD